MKKLSLFAPGLAILLAGSSFAATTTPTQPSDPSRPPPPPIPPVLAVLDANHDGVLNADEIASASKSLQSLDANANESLSFYELLLPPPKSAQQGAAADQAKADASASPSASPTDAWSKGIPVSRKSTRQSGANDQPPVQFPPNAALLVISVLDANQDYFVDADELKNASKALLTLDKNGDGEINPEELGKPPTPDQQSTDKTHRRQTGAPLPPPGMPPPPGPPPRR